MEKGILFTGHKQKCMRLCIRKDHELAEMTVQLTYVHVESEAKKYYKKNFTFSELESFATEMIEGYAPYAGL